MNPPAGSISSTTLSDDTKCSHLGRGVSRSASKNWHYQPCRSVTSTGTRGIVAIGHFEASTSSIKRAQNLKVIAAQRVTISPGIRVNFRATIGCARLIMHGVEKGTLVPTRGAGGGPLLAWQDRQAAELHATVP